MPSECNGSIGNGRATVRKLHRTTMEYYKEVRKIHERERGARSRTTAKIKSGEAGKLRNERYVLSYIWQRTRQGRKTHRRLGNREAERQRYLRCGEKNEIRKEIVLLRQDTVKGRDRAIAEPKETMQVY